MKGFFLLLPSHAAEHHRNGRNRSLNLSEHPIKGHKLREFSNSRPFRGAQENPVERDQVNGCPFFRRMRCCFVFFAPFKTGYKHPLKQGIKASKENELT
jgi:hypothetical protein